MDTRQANRLLKVAQALRESPSPERFTMDFHIHATCGTPACALGHYAARADLQRVFKIKTYISARGRQWFHVAGPDGFCAGISDDYILDHFGIGVGEAIRLFDSGGCGNAQTPIAAARYIERFVESKGFDVEWDE